MRLSTAGMAKSFDEYTINELKVPALGLMSTAGERVGSRALAMMGDGMNACVFVGGGNNGGDGLRAAETLIEAGKWARVILVTEGGKLSHDGSVMLSRLTWSGGHTELFDDTDTDELAGYLEGCSVIIDAIYGFGFHGELTGNAKRAAQLINASPAPVLAVDIPSGVEADSGLVCEGAVRADVTLTFTTGKTGQFTTPGALFCGRVEVCDIGVAVPKGTRFDTFAVTADDARLPARRRDAQKGDFGRVLIIAGSVGYTGAPALAARAAVRSGAGLVYLGVPESIYAVEAVKNDEAMVFPLPDKGGKISADAVPEILERLEKCDVCLIGPGLGISGDTFRAVCDIVEKSEKPVIVDADGITALAAHIDILQRAKAPVILTPHEGEFRRLGGGLGAGRLSAAREFAEKHGCVLVLKGCATVTAFPDGTAYLNTTGNPGMAKGGSGDVLAGMLAALIPQLGDLKKAVPAAVWHHGRAGDRAAQQRGEYAMTAGDMAELGVGNE